jgi:hypothetical protein
MSTNSKLFDSIGIKPRGAKKAEEEARAAAECNWEGCEKPGTHKAPKGRNYEGEYVNFCMEHVREYNKNYNYFSGLGDKEIRDFQKESMTGHRPTWKTASNRAQEEIDPEKLRANPTWFNKVRDRAGTRATGSGTRQLKKLELTALKTLGLDDKATKEDINKKYKALVKLNHPDANQGDRSTEDRLRQIIQAYKQLKQAGLC